MLGGGGMMAIGLMLKATDGWSGVLGQAGHAVAGLQNKVQALRANVEQFSRAALADGLVVTGAMSQPVKAFAELEDAATRLKVTMMGKDGSVSTAFAEIDRQAKELGNKLPGATNDFYNMAAALKSLGVSDQALTGGVLKSAAYLGVVLRPLGVSYEQAAESTAKFKEALGIAEGDMVKFADTIQRTAFAGVKMEEMRYAFSKAAGTLQGLKIQGLEAANAFTPLVGMLIKTGRSGEETGTALANVMDILASPKGLKEANKDLAKFGIHLNTIDAKGNFVGIEGMVRELDKLNKLNPAERMAALEDLFGKGGAKDVASIVVNKGMAGYQGMVDEMKRQADLNQRVEASLGTLTNLWDAASGTFKNALAAWGESMGPELKALTQWFNDLSASLGTFIATHPDLSKWIGVAIGGFGAVAVGLGAAGLAFAGVLKYVELIMPVLKLLGPALTHLSGAWKLVTLAAEGFVVAMKFIGMIAKGHPILLAITLIATAALLIYENWDRLKGWFTGFWDWLKVKAGAAAEWLKSLIPDWMLEFMTSGEGKKIAAAQPRLAPALPSAARASTQVGGEIHVKIDSEGRPRQVQATSRNAGVPLRASVGHTMALP